MSFAKLIGLLGDDTEAVELAKSLETNTKTLVSTVNEQEMKLKDAVSTRDKAKEAERLALGVLGIDEITEDALKALKTRKPDEAQQAEINNLQKMLDEANDTIKTKDSEFTGYKSQMLIEQELNKTELVKRAKNDVVLDMYKQKAIDGAVVEDGKVVFKSNDGSTVRNELGQPLSINERVNSFISDKQHSDMFTHVKIGGSNMQPNKGAVGTDTSNLTPSQMMNAGRQ